MRLFCCEHFISSCYAQLEAYAKLLEERRLGETHPESVKRFVHECLRQSDTLELTAKDLNGQDRSRLFHVMLWAAELGRNLRRSPRKVAAVGLRLRFEKSGKGGEEETETRILSRYGASMSCRHSVELDETLRVVRLDNGRQAHARVAWYRQRREGELDVGIEFFDSDNFWGLDWSAMEGA